MKRRPVFAICLFNLLSAASASRAVPSLIGSYTALPGTDLASRPELSGVIVDTITTPFSLTARNLTGNVESRVVRETVARADQ